MENQEIINSIEKEIKHCTTKRDAIQNYFSITLMGDLVGMQGDLLHLNNYIGILTQIKDAEKSKDTKEKHIRYFIKEESRRLIDYDRTNKSTSILSNFQDDVYRNVNRDLINFFTNLLNG